MASIKSKIFSSLLHAVGLKQSLEKEMTKGTINRKIDMPKPPKILKKKLDIKINQIEGKNVFILRKKHHVTNQVILYLHGGAYIHNINIQHWLFLESLIEASNCTIIVPEYPLAPKNTYEDAFKMVEPLYKQWIAQRGANNMILMGDSAGGGFALALAEKLRKEFVPQPAHIILLSPWLDISMNNPDIKLVDGKDPLLGIEGLQLAGKSYAKETDVNHYLLSPINGPIEGLGEISLFIGTHELFIADARKFKALCESKGISINYFEYQEMPHDWVLMGFPESKQAISEIINLIG